MFPIPNAANQTATIMGGWILSIPETSTNKDLVWELITTILKYNILSTRLVKYWYLQTQIPIGQGPYTKYLNQTIPYYNELISVIPYGHNRPIRPIIPEYQQIPDHIRQTIDEVFNRTKKPKQELDEARYELQRLWSGLSVFYCP